ncbi:MAG: VOC family protein [Verrucomicrobiia bacterium]
MTTVRGNPHLPGKFVWVDLVTDDVVAARTFYARLFGWTFQDAGGYMLGVNDERPLCGMFQRPRPADKPNAKPRWFGYISVPSVARAERAAIKAGGRLLAAPKKMPKRGEQAVFADPEGALFGVIKSDSGDPEDFLGEPGDWIWIQLISRDARKAAEFYRAVAGYDIVENDTSARPNDYVFVSKGYARAAALTLPKDKAQVAPTWLPFVRVKNVGECVAQAGQLGGKVLLAPTGEVFNGKLAIIVDPTGAEIGVMEWSDETLKEGGRP